MSRLSLFVLAACLLVAGCTDQSPVATQPLELDLLNTEMAVQRPIEEFVAAQGTFCWPDGGDCVLFVPPIENFLGWLDPVTQYAASVDYAGLANRWIEDASGGSMSFGTTFSGRVTERPLADGRAHVSVVLHTENALAWVAAEGDFTGTLLFGARAPDVMAGATAALAKSQTTWEFINTAPGAPLPDLMQLIFFPEPEQGILGARTRVNVTGELREAFGVSDGTPGAANIKQVSAFVPGQGAVADGFPVEFIKLKPIAERVEM